MKKKIFFAISSTLFLILLSLSIYIFITCAKKDITILHGKVTNVFEDVQYEDGTFLIKTNSSLYMDSSLKLQSANAKFNTNIRVGDQVYVICKTHSIEIAPKPIDIYFMIHL